MKIINDKIQNKRIKIDNINLTFSSNGIYLIQGEVGCGKTTLLEHLVYGHSQIEFEDKHEKELYDTDRYNLFTYIPQNYPVYRINVLDYITKWNKAIEQADIDRYLAFFNLDDNILSKDYSLLSGGEQVKILIISGLLKNTPYVFLDEPTNNLDDNSVESLNSLLRLEAQKRIVIVVSHDPRLDVIPNKIYEIKGGKFQSKTPSIGNNTKSPIVSETPRNARPKFLLIILGLIQNFPFVCSLIILSIFLTSVASYTHFYLCDNFNMENSPAPNYIMAHYNEEFDGLNMPYIKGERLFVDKSLYSKSLTYNDIERIKQFNGVENLYFINEKYVDQLKEEIYYGTINKSVRFFSMPRFIFDEFYDNTNIDFALQYTEGELPRDNKKEIAISKNLLKLYFGYDDKTINNAIGSCIEIQNPQTGMMEEYSITGFSYYDLAIISFEKENDFGVYQYDEKTFEKFRKEQAEYLLEIDSFEGAIFEMYITTKNGYEANVLNDLMKEYPANYYYSEHYVLTWARVHNSDICIKVLFINLALSFIMAFAFWFINKNAIKCNMLQLYDLGNYYIAKKKVFFLYNCSLLGMFFFVSLVILFINCILSSFYTFSNYYILINTIVLIIPILISGLFEYKKKWC